MGWTATIANALRELRDYQRLLAIPRSGRPIVVYSEDTSSFIQFEGYLQTLMEKFGQPIAYVTSEPNDPLFAAAHANMSVYYIKLLLPSLLPRIDSEIFITTMPEVGNLHVQRPPKSTCCLYIFHSLNSIHEVYRQGAFDHYDAFFCAGPHHKEELTAHFKLHDLPVPSLYEVGYYKLDRVSEAHRNYRKGENEKGRTILLAPSWGRGNLLESHGVEIVDRLVTLDVRVIVRPHPCFFLPIYPRGRQIVEEIAQRFRNHPSVEVERDINTEGSFHKADLMISDYSGAAYEYALGTLRPVLFIDVPRKTMNPDWQKLGLPTFEDRMRHEIGRVLAPDEVDRIDEHATAILADQASYAQAVEALRERAIYNFGHSAEVGARIIDELLREGSSGATIR